MKLVTYSKFILLMIHLSDGNEANNVSAIHHMSDYPNLYMGDIEIRSVSKELLYIVAVTNIYGPAQGIPYGQKACTGTLIRNDLVITLASCVLFHIDYDPDPYTLSVFERPSGYRLRALKVFINPNYYSEDEYISKSHDYGLIVVERSKQTVFPRLPHRLDNFNDIKNSCVMGGYGVNRAFNFENFILYNMNEIEVETFTSRACLIKKSFCLHFPNIMPCEADFGTPLICNGVLYALYTPGQTSWYENMSTKCLDFYLIVFSNVYNVKDWVIQIMDAPTSNLEWLNNPWYVLLLCCVVFTFMGGIYYVLVEFLQRTFDPAEGMQTQMALYRSSEDEKDDEDSWYESQWITR